MAAAQLRGCMKSTLPRMATFGPAAASRRTFSEVTTEVKQPAKAARTTLGSRLRSFIMGFTVAGTMSGYALYYKVQWTNEELAAMVRETAARQAVIERRLSQLESR
eukprot:Skav222923  [mRNA]  locus=scaffold1489:312728:315284:+ [translate_table: standard]